MKVKKECLNFKPRLSNQFHSTSFVDNYRKEQKNIYPTG